MEKSSGISEEDANKANTSQPLESKARQELLETNKFLYIASIGCSILVVLCIILGIGRLRGTVTCFLLKNYEIEAPVI